ncbi:ferredoxin [Actinocorallia herbida]|uniref:Ferredoxin n=1 Tax=Actinocorallia herbida TaxID=58109 RepID=A0A3N1D337_9ACTN|nr:ferredoxin [Actinocorallia herbida]ROO87947.1 ferredoxin [Actinocorallia herbida]
MHIAIDPERCQGHALCLMAAPDLLDFDEEAGRALSTGDEVPPGGEAAAGRAAATCPERALTVRG